MTDLKEVDKKIESQMSEALAELGRLCSQPSIAAQNIGMTECADLVSEMLSLRGFSVQILPTGGPPVVFAERTGRRDRTLLFYNHYDVQPPEPLDLWQTPPFEPDIREGKMFARGVSDDKGHLVCRLAALDAMLAVDGELPCNVKFIVEGEEEIGSVHLPEFVAGHADLLAADACIWEFGGTDHTGRPILTAGLRGICYVELRVRTASQDAHSGLGGSIFPNAAWRLTWALASLKGPDEKIMLPGFYDRVRPPSDRDLELLERIPDVAEDYRNTYGLRGFIRGLSDELDIKREEVFSPTCTICGLTSGYQAAGSKTVLPATASAKVDFRLIPDQSPEDVLSQLRTHLDQNGFSDVEVTLLGAEPPGRTDPDDPFLQLVAETAREVYGVPQLIVPMSGGSGPNQAFIQVLGVPIATAGISYPGAQVHAPNENIVLENFTTGVRHTARIVTAFAEA
ncbi:MAG TPA: M20/M25/M40 family metallo-hydrolase [Anaerolineales bacterium]|nr:M20/M25/M40 family metallo-hydrolase [Anaerolineales bacterium]